MEGGDIMLGTKHLSVPWLLVIVAVVMLSLTALTQQIAYANTTDIPDSSSFTDVNGSFLTFDVIDEMSKRGVLCGTTRNTFRPVNPMTGEQLAAVMIKALNLEIAESEKLVFEDAVKDYWTYSNVEYVQNYFKGYIEEEGVKEVYGDTGTITTEECKMVFGDKYTIFAVKVDAQEVKMVYGDEKLLGLSMTGEEEVKEVFGDSRFTESGDVKIVCGDERRFSSIRDEGIKVVYGDGI